MFASLLFQNNLCENYTAVGISVQLRFSAFYSYETLWLLWCNVPFAVSREGKIIGGSRVCKPEVQTGRSLQCVQCRGKIVLFHLFRSLLKSNDRCVSCSWFLCMHAHSLTLSFLIARGTIECEHAMQTAQTNPLPENHAITSSGANQPYMNIWDNPGASLTIKEASYWRQKFGNYGGREEANWP